MTGSKGKKIIVISAVNLFEGGTLTVLRNKLDFAESELSHEFKVIALIHKKDVIDKTRYRHITFLEFPKSRESYFRRLYLEYYFFGKLAKRWDPYIWFSLHDITPSVEAKIRVVYCHNPTPFRKVQIKDLFFQPIVFFFSIFYKFLYKINIKKNNFVVVQQIWIKKAFEAFFNLRPEKVLVCYPEPERQTVLVAGEKMGCTTFFYPALPRPFKNFEVIGEAIKVLKTQGLSDFKIIITISGEENNYAKYILNKYGNTKQLDFIGRLSPAKVHEFYSASDALLFPSTLETWGLPITEYKAYQKPIIVSRLPYAFETVGLYNKAMFFNPDHAVELAKKMRSVIEGSFEFDPVHINEGQVLTGWKELYKKILDREDA